MLPIFYVSSCSKVDLSNLTISQLVDHYYPSNFRIELRPWVSQEIEAKDDISFPKDESIFSKKPEDQPDLDCEYIPEKNEYFPFKAEIKAAYRFTKLSTNETIEKKFLVQGFKEVPFKEYVDEIYKDVKIELTEEGKKYTASQYSDPSMINNLFFDGLPQSKDGIKVEVESIKTNEQESSIEISYKFSKNGKEAMKSFTVKGFKPPTSFDEIVNEQYPEIIITPTKKALEIPLTKENWPVEKITSEYFNGLPVSKGGITVVVFETKISDDADLSNFLFISFKFSKNSSSIYRTYGVNFSRSKE